MSEPRVHRLVARELTAEAFAPYGIYGGQPDRAPDWVASGSRVGGVTEGHTSGGALVAQLWNLGDLAYSGDVPYLGAVRYFHQGFRVAQLERHTGETQTWLACRGTSFLVVARPEPDGAPPAPEAAAAFVVEPGDLVAIGQGVWMCHFFPLGAEATYLVVTARRAPEQDRDLANLVQTAGTVLEIAVS